MDAPYIVPALLAVHRERVWHARSGGTWSWSRNREQWFDETKSENDRSAWHSQASIERRARRDGPYTEIV